MKKAVQQIMLGTVTKNEKQTAETLRRIRAAGYDGIELNGFMVKPTSFLVRMLTKAAGMPVGKGGSYDWNALVKEAGLCVTSIHEDLGTIRREPETVVKEAEAFGTKYVVITGMYRFDYADKAAVQGLCRDLNVSGKILKEAGIALCTTIITVSFCTLSRRKRRMICSFRRQIRNMSTLSWIPTGRRRRAWTRSP